MGESSFAMGSAEALGIGHFLPWRPGRFRQKQIEAVKTGQFRIRNGVGQGPPDRPFPALAPWKISAKRTRSSQDMTVQDSKRGQPGPSGSAISCPGLLEDFGKKNSKKSRHGSSELVMGSARANILPNATFTAGKRFSRTKKQAHETTRHTKS